MQTNENMISAATDTKGKVNLTHELFPRSVRKLGTQLGTHICL